METLLSIFREVRDPRDVNSRHLVPSMLFISVAATLCGAKSAVEIADFGEANAEMLGEIVELAARPVRPPAGRDDPVDQVAVQRLRRLHRCDLYRNQSGGRFRLCSETDPGSIPACGRRGSGTPDCDSV